ncbi:hypothetical protein K432DRAFT_421524 [Lepidopterella palustris CBS 459.81]|uniref:Uncharacterized protein n=1 Tax=Lepidopterella palustris CBS 459.81 TaxID=1314670 RepID=A0A8E2EL79_9PEZI|nr:hypothetical protein K432DRAFT_421524 [Lepidopterella palustris CBS 459.81]
MPGPNGIPAERCEPCTPEPTKSLTKAAVKSVTRLGARIKSFGRSSKKSGTPRPSLNNILPAGVSCNEFGSVRRKDSSQTARPSLTINLEPTAPFGSLTPAMDSNVEVAHSSPIPVPASSHIANINNNMLPPGTVPDSPVPLLIGTAHKSITSHVRPDWIEMPFPESPGNITANANPTPMPGTNLALDEAYEAIPKPPTVSKTVSSSGSRTHKTQSAFAKFYASETKSTVPTTASSKEVRKSWEESHPGLYDDSGYGLEDIPDAESLQLGSTKQDLLEQQGQRDDGKKPFPPESAQAEQQTCQQDAETNPKGPMHPRMCYLAPHLNWRADYEAQIELFRQHPELRPRLYFDPVHTPRLTVDPIEHPIRTTALPAYGYYDESVDPRVNRFEVNYEPIDPSLINPDWPCIKGPISEEEAEAYMAGLVAKTKKSLTNNLALLRLARYSGKK